MVGMKKENIIMLGIGIIGIFILPPIIDFILGIGLFIFAISEKEQQRCNTIKLYGGYFFIAGVIGFIYHSIF